MSTLEEASLPGLERLVDLAKIDVQKPIQFPLENVTRLNLSGCGLEELPAGFEKAFPNLSILFLSGNRFRQLPSVLGLCEKLQMIAFKSNQMESIHPDALQPQLRWLILTDNKISEIPESIGRCSLLQKCMLSGNRLKSLPDSIHKCTNLELIRLASNQLDEPPMKLLKLPRLAWVGLSDNPFLPPPETPEQSLKKLKDVDESSGQILGQGAGGITRKVLYNGHPVAVKNFAGDMTSDGMPAQERRISCATSVLQSPALIQVLGETTNGSLVMEFLDQYQAIADPPSFESCSRDVYKSTDALTAQQGESLVTNLLQALTQLHSAGIIHGDFYGHNILIHQEDPSRVRLSDFGAAFFYDKKMLPVLETIEMRAFAIFVEEVICLVQDKEKSRRLASLVEQCRVNDRTFESLYVWWKQQQLKDLANAFGAGVDKNVVEESKE